MEQIRSGQDADYVVIKDMGAPTKILVVEDQPITARDLAETLQDLGHHVVGISRSAEDAIWQMKLHDPDLVLSDILIEGDVDGISLGRIIREEFQAALVFVTSHADRQTIERAAAVKPNGYIVKPFVLREVDAAVTTALANFVEEHSSVDLERLNANRADGLSPSIMAKIDDFLDHGFDTEITIEQLAGVAGMSVSLFSRQFKQSTGSSPYHYVVQRRINEAKRLLNHTDLSIAEISLSVGYSNQAHFTTAFKKFCGITPGKYRKL